MSDISPGTSKDILNAVPAFHSSESDSDEVKQATKKQRRGKNWIVINQFPNAEEAGSFIKSEGTWSRNYTRTCEDGTKKFYRCNRVKKRGPQCDAELYFLYVNDGDNVIAYQTDCEHSHDAIGTRDSYGVHEETKLEIDKLLDLRLKPKGILAALSKIQGVKMPSKRQLDNYLSDRRSPVFGRTAIYLGELEQWINKSTAIPDDDNEVFVISYHRIKGNEPSFRFALSTKRLLGVIRFTDVIHADASCKLIWQGFPVLTVGATDRNRKFHPLCLWVACNQRQEDFEAIFDGLKEKVMLIYDHVMRPRVLVCDGAQSIQNAFYVVFGVEPITRICWSRAKKNMQKIVAKIVTRNDQKSVLDDIDALHSASSPEVFHAAAQAFLMKWKNETDLVQHIKEEWLNKNSNWFLGAAPVSPSTNDALESFNRSIKEHNTLRERLPLARFLTVSMEMVGQWSRKTSLPEAKTIELQEWTEGYVWAKENINTDIISSDSTSKVYLICNENAGILDYNQSWSTFDEYKRYSNAFQKTTLPDSDWAKGSCDCPQFFTKYMCKHILGLAIRLKLTKPPLEAKVVPIERKRKRGRPTKSKPAIILQ